MNTVRYSIRYCFNIERVLLSDDHDDYQGVWIFFGIGTTAVVLDFLGDLLNK